MPGPLIRDPFTGPAVPQFARDARAWVDEPTPPGWWTTPQENPGPDMLTQVIKALARATGVTDPAAQPMMLAATGVPRVAQPIKAYHGSPHDFDKFSTAKIGTGEGAQAYGHGLYFAGGEDTARYYRDTLQETRRRAEPLMYAGKEIPVGSGWHRYLLDVAEKGKDATIADLKRSIKFNESYAPDQANLQRSYLEMIEGVDPAKLSVPQGRMYEVAIHADPDQMLDWDKPLSEQPEVVRRLQADPEFRGRIDPSDEFVRGEHILSATRDAIAKDRGWDRASPGVFPTERAATDRLKELGIPGIKYLDQGSRAAGEGTRNYVVFDDSLIEILKKYGFLPPLAATGGADKQPVLRSEGRANAGLQRGRILNIKPVASH